ncbi:reverse transcriptase (RNA-dependent DNA polymerase) domain-containing protein [Phthorimaea operculella]|nr:reverse transcriptase (RNA-dependent DNA polymerase) domain-containing protein [Phthorimaea operculella]
MRSCSVSWSECTLSVFGEAVPYTPFYCHILHENISVVTGNFLAFKTSNTIYACKFKAELNLFHATFARLRPGWIVTCKALTSFKGKGDKTTVESHRPITIVPSISKLIESIISKSIMQHLEHNDLLSDKQYAYRKSRSTNTAAHQVIDSIITSIDDKYKTAGIFCDLTKAFDVIQGDLLLDKLKFYVSARTYDQLSTKVNNTHKQLMEWFTSNGLILNSTKSNLMLFSAGPPRSPPSIVSPVPLCAECRFLGFNLDSHLNWKSHIEALCSRLSGAAYALRKLRPLVSSTVMRQVYFAHFHSLMSYGVLLWGASSDSERVFVLQKRALRILTGIDPKESCRTLFAKHGIMTLHSLYLFETIKYIRQNLQNFSRRTGGGRNLRSVGKLCTVRRRTELATKNPRVIGPTYYEKLPTDIKNEQNDETFYRRLKNFLLENEYYSVAYGNPCLDQMYKSRFLSQLSALGVTLCSSAIPPGKQRNGHSFTTWDRVWSGAPQSQFGDSLRPHL